MKHEENNLYKECLKDLGNECIEGSKLEYYLEKIKNNEGLDFQGNQYMCNTLIATCLRQHFYDEAVKQKHLEIWVIETGTELNETESKAKVEALEQWIKINQWIGEYDYPKPQN
ncbi:hypothetical protein [Flammeovirga aprica]|uniref:Uncharacterized protein n=1 Tax=Flammeovirga aprica JL-4 TaxID=694437 RepID=A0A7X9NZE7_9BACT|nr:hypothetical protein [Flammeovirga aprica]NME66610.1 hypothetical protein [Flammeovirga aprica JL-4]